ncbi:MAG: macro domain-containing protein [Alphaproteobacteria bacterium]|nr:macro domain-containing protein [Alphaproteobacteria bacterium]
MAQIGKIKITIKQGNIAAEDVDCIMVPEFNDCASYGGVGYAIKNAGMEDGLCAYTMAVKKNPLATGEEMITPSGKVGIMLAHVATIEANANEQFYVVTKAVLQTLISADALGVKTIAVPELGTGIIGSLTPEQSAKAIFSALNHFNTICPGNAMQELRLVIYGGSTKPAEKVLEEQSYRDAKPEKGQKKFDLIKWVKEISEQM